MEKTIVLALATGQKHFSASLCKLVEKYAELLASQGLLTTAMEYLKLVGNEDLSPELLILRDCIVLSTEPGMCFMGFVCNITLLHFTHSLPHVFLVNIWSLLGMAIEFHRTWDAAKLAKGLVS